MGIQTVTAYKYNGKTYVSKDTLIAAMVNSEVAKIVKDNGLTHVISTAHMIKYVTNLSKAIPKIKELLHDIENQVSGIV